MKILKLHHPTGHPFWQEGEFTVELPDGNFANLQIEYGYGYKIEVRQDGIYRQLYACGSGFGKVKRGELPAKLIVAASEYDKIEYVGEELVISPELQRDLNENLRH